MFRYTVTALLLSVFVVGCKHPLDMLGEGDIASDTGLQCFYEDAPCDNDVVAGDDYFITYYATPRLGWHFYRFGNACKSRFSIVGGIGECTWNIPSSITAKTGPNSHVGPQLAIFRQDVITGYESVFMGHSLFDPIAVGMDAQATEAGFTDHSQTTFFFPAEAGSPINIWNDPVSKGLVTDVLDVPEGQLTGHVRLFGMAIQHDILDIDGYRKWVKYATARNQDVRIFIALPWQWYADTYENAAAYETSWHAYHPIAVHTLIDQLREEFPYTDFFGIPYGQAAVELYKLFEQGQLPEVTTLVGDTGSSLFLDSRGHPGDILIALSDLVWLNAIYGVDMATYPIDPGYSVDLRAIAATIAAGHDANYNAPYLNP